MGSISDALGFDSSDMAQMMYGNRAIEIPINFILQKMSEDPNKIAGVFQSSIGSKLTFGGFRKGKPHMLVAGQMIFRPHLIADSNEFIGFGISNLFTQGFIADSWHKEPRFLLGPNGKVLINNLEIKS